MKCFFTHSGILLSALLFFGLSFGIAHGQESINPLNALFSPVVFTFSLILEVINAAVATLLSMAGTLLDTTIRLSLDTAWYTNSVGSQTPGVSEIITLGWGIVRDFFNLTFIFILLYNGIRIILDLDQSSSAQKVAKDVLMAALLINFSLFFTQLIMDGSNMLAVGLYNSIQTVVNNSGANSISEAINVTFANQALLNINTSSFTGFNKLINPILRLVFSGISIYVFLSVAFLFIGRFVAFFLLMITSPVWIAGKLIPRLSNYQKKFEETLFDQAMLAPIFLFFMYVIMQVMTSDIFTALSQSGITIPGGGTNKTGQILVFAILAALLLIAKSEATKLSGEIGRTVNGYLNTAAGLATGGTALLGRQVIGRAASKLATSSAMQSMADKKGVAGFLGRNALTATKATASGSFDVRASSVYQAGASKVGLNLGSAGGTGGYNKHLEEQVKRQTESAEALGYNEKAVRSQNQIVLGNEVNLKTRTQDYETALKTPGISATVLATLKANKDAAEKITGDAKAEISRLKTVRQKEYAETIDPDAVGKPRSTLSKILHGGYYARNEKVAAAKIILNTIDKDIEIQEKKLKEDINPDIRELEKKARAGTKDPVTGVVTTGINSLSTDEQRELSVLYSDQAKVEKKIRDFKLQKIQLENVK